MKKILFFTGLVILLSCKKKQESTPEPAPEPPAKGNLLINAQVYDSLGQLLTDLSGVKVKLDASRSSNTDASGNTTFNDIEHGTYFPQLLKDNYETPPVQVKLAASTASVSIPIAERSPFRAQNFTAFLFSKDSITVSFTLDRSIPAGKSARIALLLGKDNSLSAANYISADLFTVTSSNVSKYNITKLPNFKNKINTVDSTFYLKVIPVSYGEYESNLLPRPELLGENLYPPTNWLLKKNWN